MMTKQSLLQKLPAFNNERVLIKRKQVVNDIINEVLTAHNLYAEHYDKIAFDFYNPDLVLTFKALFDFLKRNVRYQEESEAMQTVKTPAAIISTGVGDCKHYSLFIGGVLGALQRRGIKFDWQYAFASYNPYNSTPGHVFVIAKYNGTNYWIDPVLSSFDKRQKPSYIIAKRPKMAIYRLSGIDGDTTQVEEEPSPEIVDALQTLLQYKVMDLNGRVSDRILMSLQTKVAPDEFKRIVAARFAVQQAAVAGLFSTIFRGVKKVSLALPRNAFLSLVGLNVFGYANKLHNAIHNQDGSYDVANKEKIRNIWYGLGGDWVKLENTINHGIKNKAILTGIDAQSVGVAVAAVPAWVATAAAVVAALMPIVKAVLDSKGKQVAIPDQVDMTAYDASNASGGGTDLMGWIQKNWLIVAVGAAGVYYLTKKPKRNVSAN